MSTGSPKTSVTSYESTHITLTHFNVTRLRVVFILFTFGIPVDITTNSLIVSEHIFGILSVDITILKHFFNITYIK
jgi:hypothetical protein